MRKLFGSIAVLLVFVLGFTACESSFNYSNLLKQEEKLIADYMKRNNYVLLDKFPEDSVFAENEFYHYPDGIYFQLVEKGSGDTAQVFDKLVLRYKKSTLDYDAVVEDFWTTQDRPYPNEVVYGSLTGSCEGWYYAIQAMKRSDAHARFIVPSKLGFSTDQNSVTPYIYEMKIKILPR